MYKFVVLSVLVFGCTAVPTASNYGSGYSGSYRSGSSFGSSGLGSGSLQVGAPQQVGLIGGQYGGSYGSGLRSGFGSSGLTVGYGSGLQSGYGSGLQSGYGAGLQSGYQGASIQTLPSVSTVQIQPVVSSGLSTGYSGLSSGLNAGYSGYSGNAVASGAQNNFGLLAVHQGQQFEQVVPAAIQQISRTVEYRPFAAQEQPIQAQVVEVEPSDNPVHLHFKTRSSTLSVSQSHEAAQAGEVQSSQAQDEPQRLITEVQKPVIQEVREVISPFRQVTQEINPVVESLHTIVTKGEGYRQQYQGANIGAQYQAQNQHQYQTGYVAPSTVGVSNIHVARPVAVQAQNIGIARPVSTGFGSTGFGAQSGYRQSASYSAPVQSSSSFNSFSASKPAAVQSYSAPASSHGSSSFGSFSAKPASSFQSSSSLVAPSSHSTSYVAPASSSSSFSSFGSKPAVSKIGSSFSSSSDSSSADSY